MPGPFRVNPHFAQNRMIRDVLMTRYIYNVGVCLDDCKCGRSGHLSYLDLPTYGPGQYSLVGCYGEIPRTRKMWKGVVYLL